MTIAVSTKSGSKVRLLYWVGVPALGALLAVGGYWALSHRGASSINSSATSLHPVAVTQGPLRIEVESTGDLAAVDNIDIVCQVEGGSTINTLIPEGTLVKKGQVLAELDSSGLRQKLDDVKIDLERAVADLTVAKEMLDIQSSTNATNLEAALVALQIAQLDMKKFEEGSYPQQEADAIMTLEKSRVTLKSKEDDLANTRTLFAKGFVTAAEVKNRELDVASARQDVQKAETDLKVLREYSHQMDLTSKKSALAQAEAKVERTKRENASLLSQKEADVRAKEQALQIIQRKKDNYEQQLIHCIISAPDDGMVVYVNNSGDRGDRQPVQEGATVRERQTIMRLPDLNQMKVVLKVNEASQSMLRIGQPVLVRVNGVIEPVTGKVTKLSPVADSGSRWADPDRKEYPTDVVLDKVPPGVKPGTGARATILVNEISDAVQIPLATLYTSGRERFAFVLDGADVTPVKITTGPMSKETIQVKTGLTPGQQVLLLEAGMGQALLAKAGIAEASTQPSEDLYKRGPGGGRRNGGGAGAGPARPTPGDAAPGANAPRPPGTPTPPIEKKP